MEIKTKYYESKNIQTVKRNKPLKNKRKCNRLLNNNLKVEEDKHFRFHSLRNSFCDLVNNGAYKLFTTELDNNNKNNFWSFRNNYAIKKPLNIKNNHKSPLANHKKNILNTVMDICHDIYESKNKDNNKRMKLRENIIKNVNNYLFCDLNKNILCPKIQENKKKIELFKPNNIKKEKEKDKNKNKVQILKSIDSNRITVKTLFQKYSNKPKLKNVNLKTSRIFSYENYANTNTNYKHPQIYTLNNNFKKYFPLNTQKNLQTFLDFSKLIPERKGDQKEINKQLYSVYKTMKNRNENTFHI